MDNISASARYFADSAKVAPGGVHSATRHLDPERVFMRAEGAYVYDADGNRLLDYHAAFGPMVLGHVHPYVTRQVADAIQRTDLYGMGATDLEIAAATKVCAHVPSAERVLFCNSGSEATFHAIRLSRAVTGRKKMIKFQGCFHGWHDYVARNMLSAPNMIGKRDLGSAGMLDEAVDATLICTFNDLDDVERTFQQNRDEIACIIVEPIPHNVGCLMPLPGFLEGLREMTTRYGALLIFDEVITGFRHGLGGYQDQAGVTPDLTALGKAMANGFRVAALAGKGHLMERFSTYPGGDVLFAGTYNGHAVGTAATLATIELMEREPVHKHLFRLGERVRQGLRDIVDRLGVRATVGGFGSVFVTYFMDGPIVNYSDFMRNDVEAFVHYRLGMIERGIFMLPLNLKRNHISYAHNDADIDETLQATEDVLRNQRRGRT